MKKKVLDVGQCPPDHRAIRNAVESIGAEVEQVALPQQAMELLQNQEFALVLVNRKIDQDYTDGIELVKMMQDNLKTREIPIMLVSNFPESQKEAVSMGAVQGFGKLAVHSTDTQELLKKYLA